MTELARSQIAGAVVVPPVATDSSTLDKRDEQQSSYSKQQQDKIDSDRQVSNMSGIKDFRCYKRFLLFGVQKDHK